LGKERIKQMMEKEKSDIKKTLKKNIRHQLFAGKRSLSATKRRGLKKKIKLHS